MREAGNLPFSASSPWTTFGSRRWIGVVALAAALFGAHPSVAADKQAPYAGFQNREIKALSRQQVDDLLNGRGMSLALAAELNGYPGPKHVLEHAAALNLEQGKERRIRSLVHRMKSEAIPLGRRIVDLEAALDRLFATASVDEAELTAILENIAKARGDLRFVHLKYHLVMRAMLSHSQIAKYQRLRGYRDPAGRPRMQDKEHHR